VTELCEARQRAANGWGDGIQGAYGTHKVGNCLQSVPDNDRPARDEVPCQIALKGIFSALLILLEMSPSRADKAEV
jgi:hypothetical protein